MSAEQAQSELYPLFLKLHHRRAVVIGGGKTGAHKASELLAAGAHVTAVSPVFDGAWEVLARSSAGWRLRLAQRAYRSGDLRGARLAISATGVRDVDREIRREAKRRGVLLNVVDSKDACDFYSGAVLRRGPIAIVIGTAGSSPALARKLRLLLERALPPGLGALAEALGAARERLLARHRDFAPRAALLDTFVEGALQRLAPETSEKEVAGWIECELLGRSLPPHRCEPHRA